MKLRDGDELTMRAAKHRMGIGIASVRLMFRHPLVLPALLLAVHTVPALWAKDVWFSDEARHAAVLLQLLDNGHWLVLHLGDQFYPDKPPVYFWLLALISWIFDTTGPAVFMAGTAVSAFLFLYATVHAARCFGLGRSIALLSGLLLVSNYYFIARAHFPRMDLLFATFILLSHIGFFRFATSNRDPTRWALIAFAFAGLATLTKGPIGIVLPLASIVAYSAVQRNMRLIISRPFVIGALAFVVPMLVYLIGVFWTSGTEFIEAILIDQTLQRALDTPRLAGPFYYYLHKLPEIFLPWSLVIFFMPWRAILKRNWRSDSKSASTAAQGRRYVLISALASLIIISSFDYKITFLLITLLPQVAILCALAIQGLSRGRRNLLFFTILITYVAAALVIPFAPEFTLWPDYVQGKWIVLLAMAVPIAAMSMSVRRNAIAFCAATAIGSSIVALPYFLITVKNLDTVMSTRAFGEALADAAGQGRYPVYFHPFRSGIYDYHAGRVIPFVSQFDELEQTVDSNACGLLAMRSSDWSRWDNRPPELNKFVERRHDYESYILAEWGNSDCGQD